MRSIIGLIGLTLFAAACTRDPLFSGSPRSSHEPGAGRRTDSTGTDTRPPEEHVWLTAVRFPDEKSPQGFPPFEPEQFHSIPANDRFRAD